MASALVAARRRLLCTRLTALPGDNGGPYTDLLLLSQGMLSGAVALALVTAEARVTGWSRADLVTVTESPIHGRGVVARCTITAGTTVGRYPGVVRSRAGVCEKAEVAPMCRGYVFATDDGRFLDPTDAQGCVSRFPGSVHQ